MKVRDLRSKLEALDPELDVVCYTEDETIVPADRGFILLEIESADKVEAERKRLDDNTPHLKFGKTDTSAPLAILHVTCDF